MTDDKGWKTVRVTEQDFFEIFHRVLGGTVTGTFGAGVLLLAAVTGASIPPVLWILVPMGMPYALVGFAKWRRNQQAQVLQRMYDVPTDDEE